MYESSIANQFVCIYYCQSVQLSTPLSREPREPRAPFSSLQLLLCSTRVSFGEGSSSHSHQFVQKNPRTNRSQPINHALWCSYSVELQPPRALGEEHVRMGS